MATLCLRSKFAGYEKGMVNKMEKKVPERKVRFREEDTFYVYDKRINKCIKEDCEGTVKYGLILKVSVSDTETCNCYECNKCHMKYTPYANYVRVSKGDTWSIYNKEEVTARDLKRAEDAAKQAAKDRRKPGGRPAFGKPAFGKRPFEKRPYEKRPYQDGSENTRRSYSNHGKPAFDRNASDNRYASSDRRPYNNTRPAGSEGSNYGDRSNYGERRPYSDRTSYGDRSQHTNGSYRERNSNYNNSEKRPYSERRSYTDRTSSDRPNTGERNSYYDRNANSDRSNFSERRSYSDRRNDTERKSYSKENDTSSNEVRTGYAKNAAGAPRRRSNIVITTGNYKRPF